MATYTKRVLSGSTNGKGILITAIASAGTLIHTAVAGTADFDEIWLYATCHTGTAKQLTIQWGGTAAADNIKQDIIGEGGVVFLIPGQLLQNGLEVRAYAEVANTITVHGWVNRITA